MVFFCDMDPLQTPPPKCDICHKKNGFFLKASLTNAWIFKNVHPLHDGWIPKSQAARDELNFLGK